MYVHTYTRRFHCTMYIHTYVCIFAFYIFALYFSHFCTLLLPVCNSNWCQFLSFHCVQLTSEYQRAYQPFAFSDSVSRGCMAGLSSMDLAITREPALQQKKKSPDRMRKAPHISNTVNALIDPIDEVGKTTSQLKVSCFNAWFK